MCLCGHMCETDMCRLESCVLCKHCKNVGSHMTDALSMLKIHGVSRMKYQVCVKL